VGALINFGVASQLAYATEEASTGYPGSGRKRPLSAGAGSAVDHDTIQKPGLQSQALPNWLNLSGLPKWKPALFAGREYQIWHLLALGCSGLARRALVPCARFVGEIGCPSGIISDLCRARAIADLPDLLRVQLGLSNSKTQLSLTASQVVELEQEGVFWRPWTYMFPNDGGLYRVDTEENRSYERERAAHQPVYSVQFEQGVLLICVPSDASA